MMSSCKWPIDYKYSHEEGGIFTHHISIVSMGTPIFYFISTFHVINFSYGKCDKNLSVASISEE